MLILLWHITQMRILLLMALRKKCFPQTSNYATTYNSPAYSYFKEKCDKDLKKVKAFKAARYFLPQKINKLKPTISDIDSHLDSTFLAELKTKLADYMAAARGVVDLLDWWKGKEEKS